MAERREQERVAEPSAACAGLEEALQATASTDVVFLDPDNGLKSEAPREEVRTTPAAAVYAFLAELDPFVRRGQSVIVYQHQTRAGDMKAQVRTWLGRFGQRWERSSAWAVILRVGLVRAYFVLPAERHRETLRERGQHVSQRWGRYVELVEGHETS